MKYNIISTVIIVVLVLLFFGFAHTVYSGQTDRDSNQIANAYCVGKGYDQGFMQGAQAVCQTITVKQVMITLPQNVTP